MKRISTHVLDTTLGKPAAGVAVRLERRESSHRWAKVGASQTDQDGRCAQLWAEDGDLPDGVYRLVFETGTYYTARKVQGLYPVVEIIFEARSGESHFHLPLLLSPNGYTTYRGS